MFLFADGAFARFPSLYRARIVSHHNTVSLRVCIYCSISPRRSQQDNVLSCPPLQLQNQVHWVEVSNRTTQFRVSVARTGSDRPSKYIVGVARQVWHGGHVISSGLTWAHCVYRKNKGNLTLLKSDLFLYIYLEGRVGDYLFER